MNNSQAEALNNSQNDYEDIYEYIAPGGNGTICYHVCGAAIENSCIADQDILFVDPNLKARNGDIVIALVDGLCTVMRFQEPERKLRLVTPQTRQITVEAVVTHVLHPLRKV